MKGVNMAFLNKLAKEYFKIAAFLAYKLHILEKSVLFIEKAITIVPYERDLYFLLAGYYRAMRKWDGSVSALESVVTRFPTDMGARWALGVWLLKLRRPAIALIHIKSYLDFSNADNNYKLANIYAVLGWCDAEIGRAHV